jgi:integrase
MDPVTGKRTRRTESTTGEAEAERILTRLLAQVDAQRPASTRATFRCAIEEWLKLQEIDDSTYQVTSHLHALRHYSATDLLTAGAVPFG